MGILAEDSSERSCLTASLACVAPLRYAETLRVTSGEREDLSRDCMDSYYLVAVIENVLQEIKICKQK
jgi:hypothetical protein